MSARPWTQEEVDYLDWALRHGGKNSEIAHDTGRSIPSIVWKISDLRRRGYDCPDRRVINNGRKRL